VAVTVAEGGGGRGGSGAISSSVAGRGPVVLGVGSGTVGGGRGGGRESVVIRVMFVVASLVALVL